MTVTGWAVNPAASAAATLPSPPSASGRAVDATPAASRPCAMAVATSAAVREPLNLSGAIRTRISAGDCRRAGPVDAGKDALGRVRSRARDWRRCLAGYADGGWVADFVDLVQGCHVLTAQHPTNPVAVQCLVPV